MSRIMSVFKQESEPLSRIRQAWLNIYDWHAALRSRGVHDGQKQTPDYRVRARRRSGEHELEVVSKFVQGGRKKGAPSDAEAHQMARILLALYRGLMADLVLGVKKPEVREAWIKGTDALLRGGS